MLITPQETFLELEEAADALGMHPATLRERAAAGIIPGFKLGKEWRFRTTRIAAYAAEQEARGECFGSIREERKARSGTTSASTVSELENLLGRQIGGKPSASQRKRTSPA